MPDGLVFNCSILVCFNCCYENPCLDNPILQSGCAITWDCLNDAARGVSYCFSAFSAFYFFLPTNQGSEPRTGPKINPRPRFIRRTNALSHCVLIQSILHLFELPSATSTATLLHQVSSGSVTRHETPRLTILTNVGCHMAPTSCASVNPNPNQDTVPLSPLPLRPPTILYCFDELGLGAMHLSCETPYPSLPVQDF